MFKIKLKKNLILVFVFVLIFFLIFETVFFENIWYKTKILYQKKGIMLSLFYFGVNLIGFISLASLLFIKNRILYIIPLLLIGFFYLVDLSYKKINGLGLTLNDLNIIELEASGLALEAIFTYRASIIYALIVLLFFSFAIYFTRRFIKKENIYIKKRFIVGVNIAAMILSFLVFFKTEGSSHTRPTHLKVLNSILHHCTNGVYYGARDVLITKPVVDSYYKNIILIVDESIQGEYLSINGYPKETTPFLSSISDSFINLGIASAGANCSAASNLILMSGIQLDEFPDYNNNSLKKPNIFQFANNAGYKTHYLNGQGFGSGYRNYMSNFDLDFLDTYYHLKNYTLKAMPEEDLIIETKQILKYSKTKNFLFIVKRGCHFPYEANYPNSETYFEPTLNAHEPITFEKKDKVINSYLNSIKYTLDGFFKALLNDIPLDDTIIIYTADHGQSILENNRLSTHCDTESPPSSQGKVPLLLFTSKKDSLIKNFHFKKDIYSHYQIFPTIQKLFGYEKLKGKTLFEINEANQEQTFISKGFFSGEKKLNKIKNY